MKFRDLVLPSGECFQVPQYLYRIDRGSTHGWQLRYEGSQLFSDHVSPCKGPRDSLERALRELEARMSRFAKPTLLKTNIASHKRLDLPVGISGPSVLYRERSNIHECRLLVILPRFGKPSQRSSVYISTTNTYTADKFNKALQKAIAKREEALRLYREAERAATQNMAHELSALLTPIENA